MEILVLLALVLLNGFFAMSEIALVKAKGSRLARRAADGDAASAVALKLNAEPTRVLSTIQIGITVIGILNGIVGESALAVPLALEIQKLGVAKRVSEVGSTVFVVMLITYFSIVIGELVPKRVGQFNSEGIARLVARPIAALSAISMPFVHLLSFSTDRILNLLGKNQTDTPDVTEEDIEAMLVEGSGAGVFETQELDLVRNVFRLDERQVGSLMVPQADIVYLDVDKPFEENRRTIAESTHSRFPVCQGGLDQILGVVESKELLNQLLVTGTIDLTRRLKPCKYVPQLLSGIDLMEEFRINEVPMVFVIDEFGDLKGLVTQQDLLEALAGEFEHSDPGEAWSIQREDGSWLLDGMIPIPDLLDTLELKISQEFERARFQTLNGMIMWLLGRLPQTSDIVEWDGWKFEVMDMDGKRVDKVLASRSENSLDPDNGANRDAPPVKSS